MSSASTRQNPEWLKSGLYPDSFGERLLQISNEEFTQLTAYIKAKFGIKLGQEKRALLLGRLHNTLQQKGFRNFSDYYDYLLADSSGVADTTLVNLITTNHTFFMRETDHFDYFRDQAVPAITRMAAGRDLRIWCAGCSTGEEAYTLAMILDECFGTDKAGWDKKLLATDISLRALETARKGIYAQESLSCLPTPWRLNYFTKVDVSHSVVTEYLKKEVIFRQFNLMTEQFPFRKKFQAIFCRNVMIYFDEPTKKALIKRFYDWTEDGGYLFIGHAESLGCSDQGYQYVRPAVYRKERKP